MNVLRRSCSSPDVLHDIHKTKVPVQSTDLSEGTGKGYLIGVSPNVC